jgi:hypothetical protein
MVRRVMLAACVFLVWFAACGDDESLSPLSTGTGGAGGENAGGGGAGGAGGGTGASTLASGGSMGSGGAAGGGGATGTAGGGGTGGACTDACAITNDCTGNAVCVDGGPSCNVCVPRCNGSMCPTQNTCAHDADCNASPDARCVCDPQGCTYCVIGLF